ncbi:MAG: patatin-like phospholipase family protein [Alistipes sp.]
MMKKLMLLLVLVSISSSGMAQRPKVGLVLGGGGAKGAAHVGVLKVLEEADIPIDYIAGTSIGSIVGGLYSIGYNVNELDSLFRHQDWVFLLSDQVHRHHRSFPSKEMKEKYLLSLPFSKSKKTTLPAGVVAGQNILNLFSDMTIGYHNMESFDSLPIPFACVAIDLVSGKDVVINSGSLPLAMRSSMSIPGVFAPIERDGMILIDGGAMNNLPTNVVKEMGAEIIIGIDLTTGWRSPEEVKTLTGMIDQLTNIMGDENYKKNKNDLDLYLNPNLQGYSSASFDKVAIDTMILRGEEVARSHWDEIMQLKERIYAGTRDTIAPLPKRVYTTPETEKWIRRRVGLKENSTIKIGDIDKAVSMLRGMDVFANVEYRLTDGSPNDLFILLKKKPLNNLNIGFRFDTEEMASILLNTNLNLNHNFMRGASLALTTRLSQNPYMNLSINFGNDLTRKIGLSYLLKYSDFKLYYGDKKIDNLSFVAQSGEFNYSSTHRNLKFRVGLHYDYFSYNDYLYSYRYQPTEVKPEGFFNYFASSSFENYDSKYYPTKGIYANLQGQLFTDNMITYNGDTPFAAVKIDFTAAISVSNRFCILPSLHGRFLIGSDIPPIYQNYIGGNINGRYLSQQLAFSGIQYIQLSSDQLLLAKLALRCRIGSNHYLSALGQYAKENSKFTSLFKGNDLWGTALCYSYNSIIGPIGLEVNYSNRDEAVGVYFSLGYNF